MVKAKERDVESRNSFIIAEKARLGGRRCEGVGAVCR
jgi:hypothetical protein